MQDKRNSMETSNNFLEQKDLEEKMKNVIKTLPSDFQEKHYKKSNLVAASVIIFIAISGITFFTVPVTALNIEILNKLHFFVEDKLYNISNTIGDKEDEAQLKNIKITGASSLKRATLIYDTPEGNLIIQAMGVIKEGGTGSVYDKDDNTIENFKINGLEITSYENKSGRNSLQWFDQGVSYNIIGYYPLGELKKIVKNFSF